MARHLMAAGHAGGVGAAARSRRRRCGPKGAAWCATPAELAAQCEVVISIITASADVEQLALGPG